MKCRSAAAASVGIILKNTISAPSKELHWIEFLGFWKLVLGTIPLQKGPPLSRWNKHKAQIKYTSARLAAWDRGERSELVKDILNYIPLFSEQPTNLNKRNVQRCYKLAKENGQFGKALQALLSPYSKQ